MKGICWNKTSQRFASFVVAMCLLILVPASPVAAQGRNKDSDGLSKDYNRQSPEYQDEKRRQKEEQERKRSEKQKKPTC